MTAGAAASARVRRAIALAALAVFAVLLYAAIRARRDLTDFEVYRTAGARALAVGELYRPSDGHFQFKYLPAFALAMTPFAIVGPETAKAVWFAISFTLVVVFLRRSVRLVPQRRLPVAMLLAATTLVMARYAIRELALGQSNALLGTLLLASLAATPRQNVRAGVLAGASTFVKPYALIVLAALTARTTGGWRVLAGGIAAVAGGLLAPVAVYGWHGNAALLRGWYRTVTDTTAPNLLHPDNISLAAMWAKWLGPGMAASALAVVTSAALLLAFIWLYRSRGAVGSPAYLEFAFLMVAVPLLSPQGWDYVLFVAAPAFALIVDRWPRLPTSARATAAAVFAVAAVPVREIFGLRAATTLGASAVVPVAALGLAGLLVVLRQRKLA